jgi:cell division septation protein DedD
MSGSFSPFHSNFVRFAALGAGLLTLSACAEGQMPTFLQPQSSNGDVVSRASTANSTTSERDVEAPDIFHTTDAGLWVGRPSLGGVWVAHPDVAAPERVIVRNQSNGKFVIGALFRKERDTPGPRLQVSSEAAAALGLLAGSPTNLDVVALRREQVVIDDPAPQPTEDPAIAAADDISAAPLEPAAQSDIQTASLAPAPQAAPAPRPTPKPAAANSGSPLKKPYIQIGIFSVHQNAKNTATAMRQQGMVPTIKEHKMKGKTFYRVVVGPAQSKAEISELKSKIKAQGFGDAYAVGN